MGASGLVSGRAAIWRARTRRALRNIWAARPVGGNKKTAVPARNAAPEATRRAPGLGTRSSRLPPAAGPPWTEAGEAVRVHAQIMPAATANRQGRPARPPHWAAARDTVRRSPDLPDRLCPYLDGQSGNGVITATTGLPVWVVTQRRDTLSVMLAFV